MLRIPAALPAALRFLRLAVPALHAHFAPIGAACGTTGRGLLLHAPVPLPVLRLETAGPPRFLGDPHARALLSDPDGTSAPGQYDASVLPSAFRTASAPAVRFLRGSITRPMHSLSTLRRTDHSATTQDSLPAVGQTLPDGTGYPQGPNERFPYVSKHHILPPQAFLAQTN